MSTPFVNQIKATSSNCKKTPSQSKGPFYKVPSKLFNNDMSNNGKAIGKRIKVYGKVLDNKMVDMRLYNEKLKNRAIRILKTVLKISEKNAKNLMKNSDSVRDAINKYNSK